MSPRTVLPLPRTLLLQILVAAQDLDVIVVGGQALTAWAEHYDDRVGAELMAHAPFASKDIDFFGTVETARALAQRLGGELLVPDTADTVTPSSAAIRVEFEGQPFLIDFLRMCAGLDETVMTARAQTLAVEVPELRGGAGEVEITLLHPLDVLLSRIAGVLLLRRTDDLALRQLAVAPIIVREFVRSCLDEAQEEEAGAMDEAQDCVRSLLDIARAPGNDPVLARHGIDLLDPVECLANDPRWDARFAHHQIGEAVRRARDKRHARIDEAARRRAGL